MIRMLTRDAIDKEAWLASVSRDKKQLFFTILISTILSLTQHQTFASNLSTGVVPVSSEAHSPPAYGISATYSSVTYYPFPPPEGSDLPDKKVSVTGLDIAGNYYLSNWFGLQAGIYYGYGDEITIDRTLMDQTNIPLSSYTDFDSISTTGIRAAVLGGLNIRDPGIKLYGGIGLYYESTVIRKVNGSLQEDEVSGAALRWGIGYNWKAWAVEFWGSTRTGSPHGFDKNSGQGGWCLSYRF